MESTQGRAAEAFVEHWVDCPGRSNCWRCIGIIVALNNVSYSRLRPVGLDGGVRAGRERRASSVYRRMCLPDREDPRSVTPVITRFWRRSCCAGSSLRSRAYLLEYLFTATLNGCCDADAVIAEETDMLPWHIFARTTTVNAICLSKYLYLYAPQKLNISSADRGKRNDFCLKRHHARILWSVRLGYEKIYRYLSFIIVYGLSVVR